MGQSHPTGLTPNLLKLFEPRAPLEFQPPPEKRKCPSYTDFCERYKPVVRKGAIKPVQIMTERRQGNKKIEWFDHVLTVSAYYDFEKVLAATV